jgi:hypothetical protein
LAAWPLSFGLLFSGAFLPLVLFLLPRASLYFYLPLVLPVRCPPGVRAFLLCPLAVLLFRVLGGG